MDIDLVNLDPTAYVFGDPANGINQVTYTNSPLVADFTADQLSTIEGTVFLDQNQSGNPTGQPPLAGWTVFLDTNGSGQLEPGDLTTITGSSGAYSFSGLTPGTTYTVGLALNTGASAIYSFDATVVSGTSVYDIAGDPNALEQVGTLNGGATVGTPTSFGITGHDYAGAGDQVLKLDGATGYLSVPGTSALQPGSSSTGGGGFTVGAWIRGDQALLGGGSPTIAGTITSGVGVGWVEPGTFQPGHLQQRQYCEQPGILLARDLYGRLQRRRQARSPDGRRRRVATSRSILNTTSSGATSPTFGSDYYVDSLGGVGAAAEAVIADFNGDGKPDFAVADAAENEVLVFLNTTPADSSTASFSVFTLQDAEAPGAIAAVTLNGAAQSPRPRRRESREWNTDGLHERDGEGFQFAGLHVANGVRWAIPAATAAPDKIVTGDFNGDGSPDLAITSLNGPLVVLINTTPADATTASFGTPLALSLGPDGG